MRPPKIPKKKYRSEYIDGDYMERLETEDWVGDLKRDERKQELLAKNKSIIEKILSKKRINR